MLTMIRRGLCAVALLAAGAAAAHDAPADPSKLVTHAISVSGVVEHTLTLPVDALKQLPPQQIGELTLARPSAGGAARTDSVKGVRLRDILERAVIRSADHNDVKKMVVIASASDGYKVVFSWSELFNSPVGEGVLVYFEKNGKPLADDEGRIALVSARDLRTGPRHVKWLQAIEVRKIVD